MPVLKNPKHEIFAHFLASGKGTVESYTSAGYSMAGAYQSAHRLLKNDEICSRIAEIQGNIAQVVTEKSGISKVWVLEGLRENYERAMQHEAVRDREGNETGEYTYQGNVANKALELIGKELGMFVDRKDLTLRAAKIDEIPQYELIELAAEAGLYIAAGVDTGPSSVQ